MMLFSGSGALAPNGEADVTALYWTAMTAVFLAELAVIGATAYWGFTLAAGWAVRIAVGLMAPTVMILLWGRFAAANNPNALTGLPRFLFEAAWWGTGIAAFAASGLLAGAIAIAASRLSGLAAERTARNAPDRVSRTAPAPSGDGLLDPDLSPLAESRGGR